MLARVAEKPFDSAEWVFEIKWDGYRALSLVGNNGVQIYSRKGKLFNATYPPLVKELARIKADALIDGEIVVNGRDGLPDFQQLQDYRPGEGEIMYHVFDLLWLSGENTCGLPLTDRKSLLADILVKSDMIKYSEHIPERGRDLFDAAIARGLEGVMAKRAAGEYYPGKRTGEWLKVKSFRTMEAIIAGFTRPRGSRKRFGALVLGALEKGSLKYIGHTGTGFNTPALEQTYELMLRRLSERSPFTEKVKTNMPVTWLRPGLVCEVMFSGWTRDHKLRHPVFLRHRPDKPAAEVKI